MMKNSIKIMFLGLTTLLGVSFAIATGFDPTEFFPANDTILTDGVDNDGNSNVIADNIQDGNGFAAGIDAAIGSGEIAGIYYGEIDDNQSARDKALDLMRGFINYALAIVGLVALVYLMYHGFLVLTAGDDEDRSKSGYKGVRTAFIALAGIALSWFVLSLIFFLIFTVTAAL